MFVELILKKCAISLLTFQLFYEGHSFLYTDIISLYGHLSKVKSRVEPFRQSIPEITSQRLVGAFQA
jgi:hypothetical protein